MLSYLFWKEILYPQLEWFLQGSKVINQGTNLLFLQDLLKMCSLPRHLFPMNIFRRSRRRRNPIHLFKLNHVLKHYLQNWLSSLSTNKAPFLPSFLVGHNSWFISNLEMNDIFLQFNFDTWVQRGRQFVAIAG